VRGGDGIAIDNPSGVRTGRGDDRASVMFRDTGDLATKQDAFGDLIPRWIAHV
jgi:hypothetical protein